MTNKELIDSLSQTQSYSVYAGELQTMANKADTTRTDLLEWLSEHLERFLSDREKRSLFAKWVDTQLSPNEKQDLHIITDPYQEQPTADGRRWYYLSYGAYEPRITHQPGVEASYYGKSQVLGVNMGNEHIDVYDVVRVSGKYAKEVNYHEYAKEKDDLLFYVDAAYIQDSETVEIWDEYRDKGNMDALLCEAGYCTEGYMESAQLKNVSYTPAGSDYSITLCENSELVVVKEPFAAYAVSVKADADQILDWWYNDNERFWDLHEEVKQLIREDTLRSFESYPQKAIPVPDLDGHVAYYQSESDQLVIHQTGSDKQNDFVIQYEHDLRSIDKNIERAVKTWQENKKEAEEEKQWRRENGFCW